MSFLYHELGRTFPISKINEAEHASNSGDVVKLVPVLWSRRVSAMNGECCA
jgi:hypothetical protein